MFPVVPGDASSSKAEVESVTCEPGKPDYIISFAIETGDISYSPAEIELVTCVEGKSDYIISF